MSKLTPKPHRKFLMSFFPNDNGYEEKEVNGFWLIKHWNGGTQDWTVDLFPQDSYINYKRAQERRAEMQNPLKFLRSLK